MPGGHRWHHRGRPADRARRQTRRHRAGYPWSWLGLFSAASVAFNIAHAPDRPVAQLVFAVAPIALVLTTYLLMQQFRRPTRPRYRRGKPQPGPALATAAGVSERYGQRLLAEFIATRAAPATPTASARPG